MTLYSHWPLFVKTARKRKRTKFYNNVHRILGHALSETYASLAFCNNHRPQAEAWKFCSWQKMLSLQQKSETEESQAGILLKHILAPPNSRAVHTEPLATTKPDDPNMHYHARRPKTWSPPASTCENPRKLWSSRRTTPLAICSGKKLPSKATETEISGCV